MNTFQAVCDIYREACIRLVLGGQRYAGGLLFFAGLALLAGGLTSAAAAQVEYYGGGIGGGEHIDDGARAHFYRLIGGAFGSLIMVIAGLGAMVSAAMGAYKAAVLMLIVAVGAFGTRAMVNVSLGYDNIRYEGHRG